MFPKTKQLSLRRRGTRYARHGIYHNPSYPPTRTPIILARLWAFAVARALTRQGVSAVTVFDFLQSVRKSHIKAVFGV